VSPANNVWLLLALAACWSPSFLFIKLGLTGFPPLTLAALRVGLGAALLYALLHVRGERLPVSGSAWGRYALMGFLFNAFPFALFAFGEQHADSALAAILNGATPIFTLLLAHRYLHDERAGRASILGVLAGFAGMGLLFAPRLGNFLALGHGGAELLGLAAFVVAALSYGVGGVFSRARMRGGPPMVTATGQLLCATAMLAPAALVFERPWTLAPGPAAWGGALALAVLGTALAYRIYYRLLETATATFISTVTYVMPPIGVILGMVFLDERPGLGAIAGCALIVGAVMLVNRVQKAEKAA